MVKNSCAAWYLLGLVGCAGSPPLDDVAAEGGTGAQPAASGGAANAGAASAGGFPSSAGNGSGASVPAGGAGGSAQAGGGTGGIGGIGGQLSAGGAPGGSAGHSSAGESGGGGVDPALLPPVTLHLAGDSTVMTYEASSLQEGWGQELPQFLLAKVTIDNQAIGGASVQTFYAGRWQNIMSSLRAGDYVAAAFGANDSGTVAGRHVDPPDFQALFAKMADEVRAKQATFIAVTPAALQEWSGGVQGNQRLGPYVAVLHDFAEASDVKLLDLNARSLEFLNQIGQEAAKQIYIGGDKAHFTKQGATQMAKFVAQELKRVGSPLGAYVK
jgi:lysophospholipase L1-like esterase